jgi:hypothetical protein
VKTIFGCIPRKYFIALLSFGLLQVSSIEVASSAINADSLTLNASSIQQNFGDTYTASAPITTLSYIGNLSDTLTLTVVLVSSPAGAVSLPNMRLIETSSATVDSNVASVKPLGSRIGANEAAVVWPGSASSVTQVKFAIYLAGINGTTAPSTSGTYIVRLVPRSGDGSTLNATSLNLTIVVPSSPTAGIYSDALTVTQISNVQSIYETSTSSSSQIEMSFIGSTNESVTLTASLVSAPAGNTALPYLTLVSRANSLIDPQAGESKSIGYLVLPNSPVKIVSQGNSSITSSVFSIHLATNSGLNPPLINGTYVVRVTPQAQGGSSLNAATFQNLTFEVFSSAKINSFGKLDGTTTATYRENSVLTANLIAPALVTFKWNGIVISGCKNKRATGTYPNINVTCSWKPSKRGTVYISASTKDISNILIPHQSESKSINVNSRTSRR